MSATDSVVGILYLVTEILERRCVTCSEDDIIDNLLEDLIISILERLPIEDAVRTSTLSKKWRYRWTTMRALFFDNQFSNKFSNKGAFHHNGVIRTINKIMISHEGPILKFALQIPNIDLDSFQEVDQWMLILSRKNVRKLFLVNLNRIYPLPSYVFSCLELRKVVIQNCIFKPPHDFQGFPNLENLEFDNINFVGNLGGIVINLPQLKWLTLIKCVNVNNLNIKAVALKTLWVFSCHDAMLLSLLHSKRLNRVGILLKKPIEDLQRVERFSLATMMRNLKSLKTFKVDGFFLKFLAAENFSKCLPHAAECLKRLGFQSFSFGDLDQVQGALCMLRSSPNLKVLRMAHGQTGQDAELTSNYLESLDPPKLLKLRRVIISYFKGSRPEMLFIKLILDHSPRLEKMIIRPSCTIDAQKWLNIAGDVLVFPRASKNAKIDYVDPQP